MRLHQAFGHRIIDRYAKAREGQSSVIDDGWSAKHRGQLPVWNRASSNQLGALKN